MTLTRVFLPPLPRYFNFYKDVLEMPASASLRRAVAGRLDDIRKSTLEAALEIWKTVGAGVDATTVAADRLFFQVCAHA